MDWPMTDALLQGGVAVDVFVISSVEKVLEAVV